MNNLRRCLWTRISKFYCPHIRRYCSENDNCNNCENEENPAEECNPCPEQDCTEETPDAQSEQCNPCEYSADPECDKVYCELLEKADFDIIKEAGDSLCQPDLCEEDPTCGGQYHYNPKLFHNYSFYDIMVYLCEFRQPQPDSTESTK